MCSQQGTGVDMRACDHVTLQRKRSPTDSGMPWHRGLLSFHCHPILTAFLQPDSQVYRYHLQLPPTPAQQPWRAQLLLLAQQVGRTLTLKVRNFGTGARGREKKTWSCRTPCPSGRRRRFLLCIWHCFSLSQLRQGLSATRLLSCRPPECCATMLTLGQLGTWLLRPGSPCSDRSA